TTAQTSLHAAGWLPPEKLPRYEWSGLCSSSARSMLIRLCRVGAIAVASLLCAPAASVAATCGHMCADSIAACIATQGFRSACKRQTVIRCRREGAGVCAAGTPVVTVLSPPSSVTATATGPDTIRLTWLDGGLDVGFSVERSVDGTAFDEVRTTARNASSYADDGLASGTTYHYRVRAL